MKADGILASAIGPDRVRLVTHRDVSADQCARAAAAILQIAEQHAPAALAHA
jgi:hypothetical protein